MNDGAEQWILWAFKLLLASMRNLPRCLSEADYDSYLKNWNLSNNQYKIRLLKSSARRPKTASIQTPLGKDNQKSDLGKASTANRKNNVPCSSSREKSRTNEEKFKLSMKEYDTSKRLLENAERLNIFLSSCSSLRKAECKQVKPKMNRALLNIDFKSLLKVFVKTSSTSASRNNSYQRKVRLQLTRKRSAAVEKKHFRINFVHLLSIHIYFFFYSCTVFAPHYISDVCEARWFKLNE